MDNFTVKDFIKPAIISKQKLFKSTLQLLLCVWGGIFYLKKMHLHIKIVFTIVLPITSIFIGNTFMFYVFSSLLQIILLILQLLQVPYFATWVSEIYCSQMFLFKNILIFTFRKLCFQSSLMTFPALAII